MISPHCIRLTALVLTIVAPACLAAQEDIAGRLAVCAGERDDALRLACYDREAALLAPPAVAAAGAPVNEARSAEDNFGVHGSEVARKRDSQEKDAGTGLKRLTATVTAVSQRPRGELVVTLDNGQVWQQKETQSYFPIRAGDEISITRGALGSFHLAAAGRSTPVTRVQ